MAEKEDTLSTATFVLELLNSLQQLQGMGEEGSNGTLDVHGCK